MPTMTEVFDALRGRFMRCRHGRAYALISRELGLSEPVLQRFARGEAVSERSARRIESWCNQEEARTETRQDGRHE